MAPLSSEDLETLQINGWLSEYQACHRNRNHYDSVRWTIGSIFIGASLTLFGLSFPMSFFEVLLSFSFSISLIIVWYVYAHHVNPYVMESIVRCHQIEKRLSEKKLEIQLHKSIFEMDGKVLNPKGTKITLGLFCVVIIMWTLRIGSACYKLKGITADFWLGTIIVIVVSAFIIIVFFILHRKFNKINYGEKIRKIWDNEKE